MNLSESYQELNLCLHKLLTRQFRETGNTKLNAEFKMPFNTIVKVASEQKNDLKTDIQSHIYKKINQLEKDINESVNFYQKNENFHKLVVYKELLAELEGIL
jgi:adenylate kinase family enzyme